MLQALVITALSLAMGFGDPDRSCGAPEGSRALLSNTAGHLMLIGETHGSEQPPAFVRSLVCLSLERGESVILALEIAQTEQAGLDRFLTSDGSDEAVNALVSASRFWSGGFRDGRSSHAMLALLDYVRQERSGGAE